MHLLVLGLFERKAGFVESRFLEETRGLGGWLGPLLVWVRAPVERCFPLFGLREECMELVPALPVPIPNRRAPRKKPWFVELPL